MYPVAETFTSIQGEGAWVGQQMRFIRFAGCTVGEVIPREERERRNLPLYVERCHTVDGRDFLCDTNFRMATRMSLSEVFDDATFFSHVCLTGGEPLVQPLQDLLQAWRKRTPKRMIHIETSGTILPEWLKKEKALSHSLWIAVSPKRGTKLEMLHLADEIKLLVDERFKLTAIPEEMMARLEAHPAVFLQPINSEKEIDMDNVHRCLALQAQFPQWRLSIQLHKVIGVR